MVNIRSTFSDCVRLSGASLYVRLYGQESLFSSYSFSMQPRGNLANSKEGSRCRCLTPPNTSTGLRNSEGKWFSLFHIKRRRLYFSFVNLLHYSELRKRERETCSLDIHVETVGYMPMFTGVAAMIGLGRGRIDKERDHARRVGVDDVGISRRPTRTDEKDSSVWCGPVLPECRHLRHDSTLSQVGEIWSTLQVSVACDFLSAALHRCIPNLHQGSHDQAPCECLSEKDSKRPVDTIKHGSSSPYVYHEHG